MRQVKNVKEIMSMIRKPEELLNKEKKIRMLIAGYPGIGKTSLALSAPNALHIDVDFGADRVEARYRRPFIQPSSYDEILNDLKPENVQDFDTLVFDTGGKLISLMGLWAIKQDLKNGKRDGSLSLQGYGTIKREFSRLMDYCFYELNKHIVVVFHATEEKEGDSLRLRLMVEGGTKNDVWIPMDLGGFMEMHNNDRTLGLSNCERYYAKGTRGINGVRKIPELTDESPNDYLAKLFAQYNATATKEIEATQKKREAYDSAMAEGLAIIATVTNADTAAEAVPKLKKIKHALTSKNEVNSAFNKKTAELNLIFDKELKAYLPKMETLRRQRRVK